MNPVTITPSQDLLNDFAAQCVDLNKQAIIHALQTMPGDPIYIIESFVFSIIKALMERKSKLDILDDIGGGVFYKLASLLIELFQKDEDIIRCRN
ncbi:hypothetical protein [Mesobacillus foraminis]|uniref:Uncharacterized protein n=1 Tax=Mesobacillus foraminis TaxID=279826 RepID=A0A4R2BFC6_9BACI|nr:hypothetical protein [Mesobacillus foraminis]TCN25506.1 hypothetical protein EV146_105163 [Mesobacillus foraminis]